MRRVLRGAIVALLCITIAGAEGLSAAHAAVEPAQRHVAATNATAAHKSTGVAVVRRQNRAPKPDYFEVCASQGSNNAECISEVLAAIRNARKHDHNITKRAVILPDDYLQLTVSEQTFVIMNLERVDRGIRPIEGMVPRLNVLSHLAAVLHLDPIISNLLAHLLGIGEWRSIWASDFGPLAADYDWMYYDGYSPGGDSYNLACRKPTAPGCWGHRRNILGRFAGMARVIAGVGAAKPLGSSIAAVSAGLRGPAPHYTYTWQDALDHGANGHAIVA